VIPISKYDLTSAIPALAHEYIMNERWAEHVAQAARSSEQYSRIEEEAEWETSQGRDRIAAALQMQLSAIVAHAVTEYRTRNEQLDALMGEYKQWRKELALAKQELNKTILTQYAISQ
jgi:hypothetical protein